MDQGEFLLYTSDDGDVQVNVKMEADTVWLTIEQMAELFDKSRSTINEHILNVFNEGELNQQEVVRKIGISDNSTKPTNYYNLDVIISVGYRVKSQRGTQFRRWATERLREYIIKGFTLDDERLKQGGGRYFKELLQRVRDIRSSERNLYQQVTDIYATSIDYKKDATITKRFFATVQNKLHYAVHGMTAAEIIHSRADAEKHLMGLTSFKGDYITSGDIDVAKNYLTERELTTLNLIVSQYLDFAELQALRQKPMNMSDWSERLDKFIKSNDAEVLDGAGSVSRTQALHKAQKEFTVYRTTEMEKLESDFDKEVRKKLQTRNKPSKQTRESV